MIDNVISAEIPDKEQDETLHNLVMKLMIHGPCGASNNRTNLGCVKNSSDGSCARNYPKDFQTNTEVGEGAYVQPRRLSPEEGGFIGTKKYKGADVTIDNRWVVPYSPYLLKKYGMHCNVECCATIHALKYLFGYNYKGEEMVTVEERYQDDEIKSYETQRYVSACMAIWRLYEFDMQICYPSVYTMPVHLPGEQIVTYTPNVASAEQSTERNARTKLTAYFEKNAEEGEEGEFARSLAYEDFGTHFTWKPTERVWSRRMRGDSVGRMIIVQPTEGDRFYLHLLLKHKKGATSFNDLKTVDGEHHETFRGKMIVHRLANN